MGDMLITACAHSRRQCTPTTVVYCRSSNIRQSGLTQTVSIAHCVSTSLDQDYLLEFARTDFGIAPVTGSTDFLLCNLRPLAMKKRTFSPPRTSRTNLCLTMPLNTFPEATGAMRKDVQGTLER